MQSSNGFSLTRPSLNRSFPIRLAVSLPLYDTIIALKTAASLCTYQCYAPPPLYGDRWGIGGDLTHRMCQIPHPSITIQCQIPTLYIHTRICAGTRANACAGQKPHPWGVISWRIPYQAPPLSPTGGVGRNIDRRIFDTSRGIHRNGCFSRVSLDASLLLARAVKF